MFIRANDVTMVSESTQISAWKDKDILIHCDLKVSRSLAKIFENFANYFLKTKANNKFFKVPNVNVKGYRKA